MGARRMLVFAGMALIAGGMLFGDIFAVFILHQNADVQGAKLVAVSELAAQQKPGEIGATLASLGSLLEDRGTKVDTHVHIIGAGYLALLLALAQPYIALQAAAKKRLARFFLAGSVGLPVGIFLIHYVGLTYSPLPVIGWASVLADMSGLVLIVVLIVELLALVEWMRHGGATTEPELPRDRSWSRRILLGGGTMLVLLGFLHGAWYASADLYRHEQQEATILKGLLGDIVQTGDARIAIHIADFGQLAGDRAVKIAAHAHIIEFGLLAILLSFVQPYVFLNEKWQRRWVMTLLLGSVLLPVFVLMELRLGMLAGGIADMGGLMVVIALCGMLVGILRYSGSLDAGGAA